MPHQGVQVAHSMGLQPRKPLIFGLRTMQCQNISAASEKQYCWVPARDPASCQNGGQETYGGGLKTS